MAETCCPPGSIGPKQGVECATEVTPDQICVPKATGKMVTFQGLEIYTNGKPSTAAVIVLGEVWGIASGRLKHITDQLSCLGYLGLLPKVQPNSPHGGWENDGYGAAWDDKIIPWIATELEWSKVKPRLETVIAYAKSQGAKKIGMIGFCWGSWAIFKTASELPKDVTCGVCVNPSVRIEEMMYKRSQNDLAELIQCPIAMFGAGNDPPNTKPGGDFQKIFSKKPVGKDCVFVEFPEMEHGWAVRGDDTKPNIKADVDKVFKLSFDFLNKHCLDQTKL